MNDPGSFAHDDRRWTNPFSAERIRPGAIEYVFSAGIDADTLVGRLKAAQWRGQIVGPHGTGKSSLLYALSDSLASAGRVVYRFNQHDRQRRLSREDLRQVDWTDRTLIVVDGYEQLGRWSRLWLDLRCRWSSAGLLVTSHTDVGLVTLFTTQPSFELFDQLVGRLAAGFPVLLTNDDLRESWSRSPDNLREALFSLYDRYELHRRRPNSTTT